jgi:uncharacterized protein YoxC
MADETTKKRSTPQELEVKIESLRKRHAAVLEKKASMGGQLQAKRQELATIVEEIKAAGYDPKNLSAEHEKVEQEVEAAILDFDKKLTEAETALSIFDKK